MSDDPEPARPPRFRSAPRRVGDAGQLEVFVADEQDAVEVDAARLAALARHGLEREGVRGDTEFGLLFVDEATIAELNRVHMGSDGPTDVLAFPIDDEYVPMGRNPDASLPAPPSRDPGATPGPLLLGDVVVCPAVAARNAPDHAGAQPGHPAHRGTLDDELDLLVVHGVLHVLGHDHADEGERATMQAAERAILSSFRP